MVHAVTTNLTPFAVDGLFVADMDGRPLIVPIVRGTYAICDARRLPLANEQITINMAGKHWGQPERSSYKYEPETAFTKLSTDVVLIGHAYPTREGETEVNVTLRVGELEKTVRVIGDRFWEKFLGITTSTPPQPFEKMPLIYERAFGGWDSAEPDPMTSQFEPRNPVGVGFKRTAFEPGMPLPNLEDPKRPLNFYGDTPPPAGFGFISPHWLPRAKYAGTYDEAWQMNRAPLLPVDFDLRFFNAASPGLIASEYLKGNELVEVTNASPGGRIAFRLPGIRPPKIRVQLRGRPDAHLETNLDTVIINTDENLLLMLWRTNLVLRNGPHDVAAIEVTCENAPRPKVVAV
jgi:hypothetical protein